MPKSQNECDASIVYAC